MDTVSATLRILGLLADYPDMLSSLITQGFSQTNVLFWRGIKNHFKSLRTDLDILPQLFSRLSHPNRLVRDAIISLISRIGLIF